MDTSRTHEWLVGSLVVVKGLWVFTKEPQIWLWISNQNVFTCSPFLTRFPLKGVLRVNGVLGAFHPKDPFQRKLCFFSHCFLSNLRVSVLFLCLHTTLPQNAPLPKCTWSGLASYTQPMCFTGLIFYYFHHATKILRPARFKGSKGMSWHCDKEAAF